MKESSSVVLLSALGLALLGATGIVFLKRASVLLRDGAGQGLMVGLGRIVFSADIWVGVLLYMLAFVWLMIALPHVNVSQFYPLAVGFNIMLTTLAAFMFLNEGVAISRVIGIVLIVVGVFFVSR